jgi:nitrogen fixation protein NifX
MYRIAIASSDGESVNQHFGQARNLLIYEISDEGVEFIEDRAINLFADEAAHTERNMTVFANTLNDCSAVFVRRIGAQSAKFLHEHNIRTFEVNFSLNHVISTLLRHQKNGRVRLFK